MLQGVGLYQGTEVLREGAEEVKEALRAGRMAFQEILENGVEFTDEVLKDLLWLLRACALTAAFCTGARTLFANRKELCSAVVEGAHGSVAAARAAITGVCYCLAGLQLVFRRGGRTLRLEGPTAAERDGAGLTVRSGSGTCRSPFAQAAPYGDWKAMAKSINKKVKPARAHQSSAGGSLPQSAKLQFSLPKDTSRRVQENQRLLEEEESSRKAEQMKEDYAHLKARHPSQELGPEVSGRYLFEKAWGPMDQPTWERMKKDQRLVARSVRGSRKGKYRFLRYQRMEEGLVYAFDEDRGEVIPYQPQWLYEVYYVVPKKLTLLPEGCFAGVGEAFGVGASNKEEERRAAPERLAKNSLTPPDEVRREEVGAPEWGGPYWELRKGLASAFRNELSRDAGASSSLRSASASAQLRQSVGGAAAGEPAPDPARVRLEDRLNFETGASLPATARGVQSHNIAGGPGAGEQFAVEGVILAPGGEAFRNYPPIGLMEDREIKGLLEGVLMLATSSVWTTQYCIDDVTLCAAIEAGLKRASPKSSVDVRLILDQSQMRDGSCTRQPAAVGNLLRWGAQVRTYRPDTGGAGFPSQHSKTVTVDKCFHTTGSSNITDNSLSHNSETLLFTREITSVNKAVARFERLWEQATVLTISDVEQIEELRQMKRGQKTRSSSAERDVGGRSASQGAAVSTHRGGRSFSRAPYRGGVGLRTDVRPCYYFFLNF